MNGAKLITRLAALLGLGLILGSCSSLQAPVSSPAFDPGAVQRTLKDGIDLAVKPISEEDDYLDLFDENLPNLGIVAVWVEMRNTRAAEIDPNPGDWSLRVGARDFPALSVAKLFEQFYAEKHLRMISIRADTAARADMERVAFQGGTMPPASRREGFIFFRIDPALAPGWSRSAGFRARGIRIGPRERITIEIVLPHADP